jgi:hypothetical protein
MIREDVVDATAEFHMLKFSEFTFSGLKSETWGTRILSDKSKCRPPATFLVNRRHKSILFYAAPSKKRGSLKTASARMLEIVRSNSID